MSFNNDTGDTKPVMIVTINGGPDEYTTYTKTIQCAINYFTTQHLNAFFLATNGQILSRIERDTTASQ